MLLATSPGPRPTQRQQLSSQSGQSKAHFEHGNSNMAFFEADKAQRSCTGY
jgi:hypothetical protein